MDFAAAFRTVRARARVLGCAALVALPAPALAADSARAQTHGAPIPSAGDGPGVLADDDAGRSPLDAGAAAGVPAPAGGIVDAFGDVLGPRQPPAPEQLPAVKSTYVAGRQARMRTDGKAAIPRGAPKRVRALIAQYNRIVGKRYKWGGGHARLVDSGYDCSGAVGYGLIRGGLLRAPMVSGSFARWGAAGAGRWVTVYAHKSHVYAEIAGLRLDTSPIGEAGGRRGVRWRPVIGQRRGFAARHPAGL